MIEELLSIKVSQAFSIAVFYVRLLRDDICNLTPQYWSHSGNTKWRFSQTVAHDNHTFCFIFFSLIYKNKGIPRIKQCGSTLKCFETYQTTKIIHQALTKSYPEPTLKVLTGSILLFIKTHGYRIDS